MTKDNDTQPTKEMLVFVYGTLKKGGRLNYRMTNAEGSGTLIGEARILSKGYVMRDLKGFPALQKVEPGSGTYIKGELYLIGQKMLAILDQVEGYPHLYNRELIDVWVDNQSLKAWVYYIKTDPNAGDSTVAGRNMRMLTQADVIKSGEWDAEANRPVYGDTGACNGDAIGNDCAEAEGRDESVPWQSEGVNFEVDKGVYVNNEYGDYWGPFDSIREAVEAISDGSIDTSGSNVLSCGFRMLRKDLTDDELADIDQSTEEVYARINR